MSSPICIGGNGYRWRGKSIRTVSKQGITCATMPRKDSIIMVPIVVMPNSFYKVSITGCKNSGNGALLVNFFGGKHYDGVNIPLNLINAEMREYTVSVPTPNFPVNLPVYLRIWRPNDATGNVLIRYAECTMIGAFSPTPTGATVTQEVVVSMPREPKMPIVETTPRPVPKSPPKKKQPVVTSRPKDIVKKNKKVDYKPREDMTMKFKPYEVKKTSASVEKVLIKKAEDVPKVSIITPTRDGLELIKKCYEALDKNTDYPNWEWVVGDSLSTDGTEEWFKSLNDARVKFIQRGTTDGSFSSINNELAEQASGDYFLFLNNDTEPQPFWLYNMVTKLERNDDIGVVGCKLVYSENRIQHAGIAFVPQGPSNLGKAVLSSFPKGFAEQDRFYQAVTGACMLMRAKDFKALNGFDPKYYFCYEDVDLCLRVGHELKKKILYCANSVLLHAESVTQKKHKTSGELQQAGIKYFKEKWMNVVDIDFSAYQRDVNKNIYKVDVSFVTCVNNLTQFRNYIMGSLFKSVTHRNYEIIPILNFGNTYSAAQALNIGIDRSRANIVVLCHQDVIFYQNWIDMLFDRIQEVEKITPKWGVLGTAGINKRDDTVGVVHNLKGTLQWQANKRAKVLEIQTVDEHCMIIRKDSGLKFDHVIFNGFHFYGPDICLNAMNQGMKNFGILCPLIHDSSSGSLVSGKAEFMRLLNALATKWRHKFQSIRTPTSVIRRRSVRTFIRFKS